MPRPVLVKLGGSILTDKAKEASFQRGPTRRLLSELHKAGLPTVLLHGAGSFGHPGVLKHGIGAGAMTAARREGVSEVLALVGQLQSEIVGLAQDVGLKPIAIPLQMLASREESGLVGLPFAEIQRLLGEGHTPVLGGTLVRDAKVGWSVAGADELMVALATELEPRLCVFATDVDGIFDRDPRAAGPEPAKLLERIRPGDDRPDGRTGRGADATGRMTGKLDAALTLARTCPVLVVNGTEKNRLLDALRGKPVVSTRVEA